jgi:hypothetical protein
MARYGANFTSMKLRRQGFGDKTFPDVSKYHNALALKILEF